MLKSSRRHLLLLLGLVLFAAVAASSHWSLVAVQEASEQRAAAKRCLLTLSRLATTIADIESGQRGYLLTGNAQYLSHYEEAIARYRPLMGELHEHGKHPQIGQAELARGVALIERRVAIARRNVDERRAGRSPSLGSGGAVDRGRVAGEDVRSWIRGVESVVLEEIERLERRVAAISRTSMLAQVLLGVIGAFSILTAVLLLQREYQRRLDAEFEVHRANFALESRVRERTAELEAARATLERFAIHLDEGIEAERRRLAREVHDQLGQVFTALRLSWGTIAQRHAIAGEDRERIDQLVMDGLQTARRISAELRPPLLDEFGLADAVAHRAEGFRDETGIDCEVDMDGTDELDREQATQLFRIVQEALTNVARHSGARVARVRGERVESHYELVVEDDGRGLRSPRHGSHGLPNMRERAALAGGELRMDSPPAGGLRVHVSVPLTGRCA